MGCAQSTEQQPSSSSSAGTKPQTGGGQGVGANGGKKKAQPQLSHSLTRQMTVGEAMDAKMERGATVVRRLDEAKAELDVNRCRWIWDSYEEDAGVLLGRGAYARVFKGRQKAGKTPVAIKVISKDNKYFEQQQRAMVTKVACMRALQGHRNMVKLYEVFQEPEGDYVVLEYMPAKPLFDAIVEKGHFSEADAAVVMKQLLQFLRFMHDLDVVHRDIKPENLLLLKPHRGTYEASCSPDQLLSQREVTEAEEEHRLPWLTREEEALVDEGLWADVPDGLRLKVIDYGTSNFCEAGQHLHSKIGTARYVAPEVLARDYDKSSDIWSAGVVLYILLCGHAPFKGSTDTGTLAKVKTGVYSMEGSGWEHVSASARDLLRHMLVVDPAQRWTAEELLEHIWFQEAPGMSSPHNNAARHGYLERLNEFAGACRMKRLMLKLLANEEAALTTKEVARLKDLFNELDTDHDGLIDGPALHKALASVGCELNEHDVREFLAVSKVDSRHAAGRVDINEFIAALFDSQRVVELKPEMVEMEFKRLDVDGDGVITAADLVAASKSDSDGSLLLGGGATLTLDEAREMLAELLTTGPVPAPGGQQEQEGGEGVQGAGARGAAINGVSVGEITEAGADGSVRGGSGALGLNFKNFRELMLNPKVTFPLVSMERASTMRRSPSALALANSAHLNTDPAGAAVAAAAAAAAGAAPHSTAAAAGEGVEALSNSKAQPRASASPAGPGEGSMLSAASTNELSTAAVFVAVEDGARRAKVTGGVA